MTTTDYFQCYDVSLTNGLNIVTVYATDLAGNTSTNNLNITLDYSGDTMPPSLNVVWPQNLAKISGTNFTVQAQVSDPQASVSVAVVDNGSTNTVLGTVQRDGTVWVQNLPLASGTNQVTLTAKDTAGNTTTTNFPVVQSTANVTVDPIGDLGNNSYITVTGTVSDPADQVTVNGVSATVNGDGTWEADSVPVSPDGLASLDVEVTDSSNNSVASTTLTAPQDVPVIPTYYDFQYTADLDPSRSVQWSLGEDNPPSNWQYQQTRDDYASYQNGAVLFYNTYHIRTKVALDLGNAGSVGESKFYLVAARAFEPLEYDFQGRGQQLPPEWLQICGQHLVDSFTDDFGQEWGETLIKVPAGVGLYDVTPVATQVYSNWADYFFDMQAFDGVNLQLAVDANRDGNITFDAKDQTTQNNPYRFWVNDDQDDLDSAETVPVTTRDCDDFGIDSVRDLEDLTRLHISLQGITDEVASGTFLIGLKWKNVTGSPSINIFQAVETNGGTLYLTDTNVAQQQARLNPAQARLTIQNNIGDYYQVDTSGTFLINSNFWQAENISSDNPIAHLLFEGCSVGKGQLVITVNKPDGTEIAEAGSVWLDIKDIKSMYQRASATPSSDSFAPPYNQGSSSLYTNAVFDESNLSYTQYDAIAFQKPSDETLQCIVFVHGWNMSPDEYIGFSETMFKRLWWQGYKGRFCSFYWATLTSFDSYNTSEFRAWKYGLSLKKYVEDQKTSLSGYSMNIAAHSMGNIVAGSALHRGLTIDNYVLMQAAVPAGCYDVSDGINSYSKFADAETTTPTPDFADPNMGYRGYLTNITGNLINFHNPNDFALATGNLGTLTHLPFLWWVSANWEGNQVDYKPDIFTETLYSYDSGQSILQAGQFLIRHVGPSYTVDHYVTDPQEMMAFVARPRSQAVGALADVGGVINTAKQMDLNANFGFDRNRDEHSAEFNWNIQRLNGPTGFYHTLLNKLFPPE